MPSQIIPVSERTIEVLESLVRDLRETKFIDQEILDVINEAINMSQQISDLEMASLGKVIPPLAADTWVRMTGRDIVQLQISIISILTEKAEQIVKSFETGGDMDPSKLNEFSSILNKLKKFIEYSYILASLTLRRVLALAYINAGSMQRPAIANWMAGFDVVHGPMPIVKREEER